MINILEEVNHLITGPRREEYGPVKESFQRIAEGWTLILGAEVSPTDVALCMVWLKMVREANHHGVDNLRDIIGYAALADQLHDNR